MNEVNIHAPDPSQLLINQRHQENELLWLDVVETFPGESQMRCVALHWIYIQDSPDIHTTVAGKYKT